MRHGERKRNLKRSTLKDYRQVLDAYLLPAHGERRARARRRTGARRSRSTPLRDLRPERRSRPGTTGCRTGARRRSC